MPQVNIVIPFFNNSDTIERLLMSIEDQDYKDFDVCVVIDGPDQESFDTIQKWIVDNKFKMQLYVEMLPKNMGASYARNFGAKITGNAVVAPVNGSLVKVNNSDNILFFIDADCNLYPGMLRECVTQLEDNKDVSFVYGNYRTDNKFEFYSQDFDAKLLETMNYICTMSPVRRNDFDKVGGFKDGQKFFQDWSLFYRLAKEGFKGKYVKEFIFNTKAAEEGNISAITGSLAEKSKQFREEHGIQDKELVVTTFGAPLQAIQRAKMLGADYCGMLSGTKRATFPTNFVFDNWKGTYVVGCYNEALEMLENHMNIVVGKPIYHFIGSDVFQMYNSHSISMLKDIRAAFKAQKATIFGNSPRCVQELKECGIKAELLYTPIYNIDQYQVKKDLPKDFTVAVYYSDSNPAHMLNDASGKSNIPLIMEVAKSTPDIKYKFFGGFTKYLPKDVLKSTPDNIEFVGRIPEEEMVDFINDCSAVLRSTIHDGFPQLPIHFVMCGRQALISTPDEELKYMDKLSFEDILDWETCKEETINKIYAMRDSSKYDLVIKAAKSRGYYRKLMSVEKFQERIYKCLG